ncbi:MAG TPA: hypothetical protein VEI06_15995 [Gemmatimonadaceae bacterium]|nr:hypothetical protein [Gemmatimonadaceae bacterium]
MQQQREESPAPNQYPHGRGYGHDYMRGGEVLGGYGYASREEYERPRGEAVKLPVSDDPAVPGAETLPDGDATGSTS